MTPPRTKDDAWAGISVGYSVVSYVLAGILVGWGLGAGLDHVLHTSRVFVAILMPLGAALGVYLVYVHYGRSRDVPS
jgi:F0F1-type ATP synthase assembly protein I